MILDLERRVRAFCSPPKPKKDPFEEIRDMPADDLHACWKLWFIGADPEQTGA